MLDDLLQALDDSHKLTERMQLEATQRWIRHRCPCMTCKAWRETNAERLSWSVPSGPFAGIVSTVQRQTS